jgi:hypothetical protein
MIRRGVVSITANGTRSGPFPAPGYGTQVTLGKNTLSPNFLI